jgi:hypothetical protein
MRSRIRIQSDHSRRSVVFHGFAEEAFGSGHIPSFAQQEIHGLSVFVDRSIEIGPTRPVEAALVQNAADGMPEEC